MNIDYEKLGAAALLHDPDDKTFLLLGGCVLEWNDLDQTEQDRYRRMAEAVIRESGLLEEVERLRRENLELQKEIARIEEVRKGPSFPIDPSLVSEPAPVAIQNLAGCTTSNDITPIESERDGLQIENQRLKATIKRVEGLANGWMSACLLHEADHKSYSVDRDRMKWCAEQLTAALKGDR